MRKETSGSFDEAPAPENKTALSLFYLFGVPVLTAITNTVGSFLGYAFMRRMGSISTENTAPIIQTNNTNNTNSTDSGNPTIAPRFHPICKQAIANVNTPAQFAWITFAGTAIGFFLLAVILLAMLACVCRSPKKSFKNALRPAVGFATLSNFPASAVFPFTMAFFAFCVDDTDAWHVAGASFLGANTLMALFLMIFLFGKKGAKCCAQNDKESQLETQHTTRKLSLSNDSLQSLRSLPSPRFMPTSPSLNPTPPSPTTLEPTTTTITIPQRGHHRSDTNGTVAFQEPS